MSSKNNLQNIKKLRELTGVGFKDCKTAIEENNGDIEKSIEFLRKKGIAKASKKMGRVAADGLVLVSSKNNSLEKNVGKVVSVVKLQKNENTEINEIGSKLAMQVAASAPLAIDENGISKKIIDKELEIIKEELKNSGKKEDIVEKIAKGKLKKFISDNTLLNQAWIMDPKKKVSDFLKISSIKEDIKILDFLRFKVGEGV